jgi:glycosyltransferase involved in cell wall biosynthesis
VRVLVVCSRFDLVGGSERYAGEVVRGLGARGFECEVLCAGGDQDAGVRVHARADYGQPRLNGAESASLRTLLSSFSRVLQLSWIGAGAQRLVAAGPPWLRFAQDHTLFCPGLNKLHEDGELCTKALGAECLSRYWLRGGCSGLKMDGAPSLRFPLRALHARLVELKHTRRARRVIVASRYMRAELVTAGIDAGRVEVLPYFTSSNSAQLSPTPLPGPVRAFLERPGRTTLLTPARLVLPDKGIDYLLTALGRLPREVQLVLAGDGPHRSWLEEKAHEEGLSERVHFAGWLGPGEIESLYAACDLVVFPSVWNEPFGLVGIEAMAHGKPVVAFDCGGVREWLEDGETGRLAPRKDVVRLGEAVLSLAGDPDLRTRMGQAAKEKVEKEFRAPGHLDRLEALLRS